MTKSFSNFADLASFIASETDSHDRAATYEHAFIEHDERAKLSPVDEAEQLDMPDPEQARVAVEMVRAPRRAGSRRGWCRRRSRWPGRSSQKSSCIYTGPHEWWAFD